MPRAKQLTVQLANKIGTLAQVAEAISKAGVNMRALAVFEGRAKIITETPEKGREALQKEGLFADATGFHGVLQLTVRLEAPGARSSASPGIRALPPPAPSIAFSRWGLEALRFRRV